MHVIAAKAVAFGEALQPGLPDYASSQVVDNAQAMAARLVERGLSWSAAAPTTT
jgi:glycine hydroxymethyltransferase